MLDRTKIFYAKADHELPRQRTKWGNGGSVLVKYSRDELDKINFEIETNISKLLPDIIPETKISFNRLARSYLTGNTLNQAGDFEFYLERAVVSLKRVHEVKTDGFGLLTPELKGLYNSWAVYLDTNFQEHINYCYQNFDEFPKMDVLSAFYGNFLKIPKFQPTLLHGDPSGENMIIAKGKVWLIDWEDSISGDPIYEWAFLSTFYPNYYDKILKWNNLKETDAFWLYFLRISVMKLVVLYKRGVKDFTKGMNRVKLALSKLC